MTIAFEEYVDKKVANYIARKWNKNKHKYVCPECNNLNKNNYTGLESYSDEAGPTKMYFRCTKCGHEWERNKYDE